MESSIVDALVREKNVRLKLEWVTECLSFLRTTPSKPVSIVTASNYIWEQYLLSDVRVSGEAVLPPNVSSRHKFPLAGPFVLQVHRLVFLFIK